VTANRARLVCLCGPKLATAVRCVIVLITAVKFVARELRILHGFAGFCGAKLFIFFVCNRRIKTHNPQVRKDCGGFDSLSRHRVSVGQYLDGIISPEEDPCTLRLLPTLDRWTLAAENSRLEYDVDFWCAFLRLKSCAALLFPNVCRGRANSRKC
jgi:hypothetical protein